MASIVPMKKLPNGNPAPGTKWRVFIRIPGHEHVNKGGFKNHPTAKKWAKDTEDKMTSGVVGNFAGLSKTTVHDIFAWYIEQCDEWRDFDQAKWERNVLKRLSGEAWTQLTLDKVDEIAKAIRLHIKRRVNEEGVKGQTVARQLSVINTVYKKLATQAGFKAQNPVKGNVEAPATAEVKRYQVWSDEALNIWLEHLQFDSSAPLQSGAAGRWGNTDVALPYLAWTILLLNSTGLRPKSLFATRLEWIKLGDKTVNYPPGVVKNREPYACPLDPDNALPLMTKLIKLREGEEKLFGVTYGAVARQYDIEKAKLAEKHPELAGLCLYGHRHTWTTANVRYFQNVIEFLAYSGRKSVKDAMPYFREEAGNMADTLAARRAAMAAGTMRAFDRSRDAGLKA